MFTVIQIKSRVQDETKKKGVQDQERECQGLSSNDWLKTNLCASCPSGIVLCVLNV